MYKTTLLLKEYCSVTTTFKGADFDFEDATGIGVPEAGSHNFFQA